MIVQVTERYKEAMSSAYIPAGLVNAADNSPSMRQSSFAKELGQKSDFIHEVDLSHRPATKTEKTDAPPDKTDNGKKFSVAEKEQSTDRKAHPEPEQTARKDNPENPRKESDAQPDKNNAKPGNNRGGHETDENAGNGAAAEKQLAAKFRNIVKEHHIKIERLASAKNDAGENFSEGAKLKAETTAEKTALNVLDGKSAKKGPALASTSEENKSTENSSLRDDVAQDKQLMAEMENAGKDAATAKTSVKIIREIPSADAPDSRLLNPATLQDKNHFSANDIRVQNLLKQAPPEHVRLWNEQIVSHVENSIKMLISDGDKKVGIQLQPPELGKVQVEMILKDNRVDIRINTENQAVKEVILSNLNQLRTSIEEANITVNKFDVEVGGFKNSFDQTSGEGGSDSRKGGGRGDNDDPTEMADSDWLPDKIIRQQALTWSIGRSINYLV